MSYSNLSTTETIIAVDRRLGDLSIYYIYAGILVILFKEFFKLLGSLIVGDKLLENNRPRGTNLYSLIGLLAFVAVIKFVNYFFPLKFYSFIILIIFIVLIYTKSPKKLKYYLSVNKLRNLLIQLVAVTSLLFFSNPYSFDSYYYAYQIILWKVEFPLSIGLGNFFPWLVTSSYIFDLSALASSFIGIETASSLVNLVLLLLVFDILYEELALIENATLHELTLVKLYSFVSLILIFAYGFSNLQYLVLSPNPDYPNFLFLVLVGYFLTRFRITKSKIELFGAVIAASLSFSLRSHSLIIFSIIFLYFLYNYYSAREKHVKFTAGLMLLISPILFWIIDNYLKSGYPLFPSKLIQIQTNWVIGIDSLDDYIFGLRNWTYQQTCSDEQLMSFGFSGITCVFLQTLSFKIVLIALIIILVLFSQRIVFKKDFKIEVSFILILGLFVVPVFILLIYSPQLRFIYSYIFVILILAYSEIINELLKTKLTILKRRKVLVILGSLILIMAIYPVSNELKAKWSNKIETDKHQITSFRRHLLGDGSVFYYYVGRQCGFNYFPCTGIADVNIRVFKNKNNNYRFEQSY